MAQYVNKTIATDADVAAFIATVEPQAKRDDAAVLLDIYGRVTGLPPKMWGPSIIGYGSYDYTYDSGHSGTACRAGFSPRKAKHSLYLMAGPCDAETAATQDALLARLGKWSMGKACLYINRLDQVDLDVLEQLVALNWDAMHRMFPEKT